MLLQIEPKRHEYTFNCIVAFSRMGSRDKPKTLDNLMLAYADLNGPLKKSSFKGPALNQVQVEKREAPKFQVSSKARDWSSLSQNLEDVFGGSDMAQHAPSPLMISVSPLITSSQAHSTKDDDEWGDFHGFSSSPVSTRPSISSQPVSANPNKKDSVDDEDEFGDFVSVVDPVAKSFESSISSPYSFNLVAQPEVSASHQFVFNPTPSTSQSALPPTTAIVGPPSSSQDLFFADFSNQPISQNHVAPTFVTSSQNQKPLPTSVDAVKDDEFGDFVGFSSSSDILNTDPTPQSHAQKVSGISNKPASGDKYGALRDIFDVGISPSELIEPISTFPQPSPSETRSMPESQPSPWVDPFGSLDESGSNVPPPSLGIDLVSSMLATNQNSSAAVCSNLPKQKSTTTDDEFGDFLSAFSSSSSANLPEKPAYRGQTSWPEDVLPAIDPSSFASLNQPQSSSSHANIIPWHPCSPPPPPISDDNDSDGYNDDVLGGHDSIESSDLGGGMSALNALTTIDFTLDLAQIEHPMDGEKKIDPQSESEVSPNPSLDQEVLAGKIEFHNNPDRYRDHYRITPDEDDEDSPFQDWIPALNEIQSVMENGAEICTRITIEGILDEIEGEPKYENYLKNLREIYRVYLRIRRSYERLSTVRKDIQEPCDSIETFWRQIMLNTTPSLNIDRSAVQTPEGGSANENDRLCGICLTVLGDGDCSNAFRTDTMNNAIVQFELHQYHAPCANFWINLVNPKLPGLHVP